MANNNTYDGATLTVSVKDTSYDNIIYQPTKPVLDSELNFMSDLNSAKLQDFVRSKIPSGWLDASFTKGFDSTGNSFGINSTLDPNSFVVHSTKETPLLANVNGWLLQIGGTGIAADNKLKITLPDAPSSSARSDLVFLEVWKVALEGNSTDSKPGLNTLYKFGNTEYAGVNLADQIINPSMNFKTTKRVQIQYRLRVIQGPDFLLTPEGINDPNSVNAQGSNSAPVSSYPFSNAGQSWDDFGLYVAGNGSSESRDDLGTVDGYVYAIPMFRVHRRNKGAFATSNQNGSSYTLGGGVPSDRPDGLFHDQVHIGDIEDLRHSVSFASLNYQEILDKNLDDIFSGNYSQILSRSGLEGNLETSTKALYINRIATSSVPNTDLLRSPSVPQRYFSDVPASVATTTFKPTSAKTAGTPGSNWLTADEFSISSPPSVSRSSSVIGTATPVVKFAQASNGPILTVTGTWTGLGTSTAVFTLGTNSALTDQILYITYDLDYNQIGDKLTKPISEMLRVQDNKRNEDWGFISLADFDSTTSQRRRLRTIIPRSVSGNEDYAYVYRLNSSFNNFGMSTVYSYHMNSTGISNSFTLPASIINSGDAAYVYSVFNVSTNQFLSIQTSQKNFDGSLSVVVTSPPTGVLRFDIALIGGVIEFDKRTQSIVDMGRVEFYSIEGNGLSQIVLKQTTIGVDPTELVIGNQVCFGFGAMSTQSVCYVGGQLTPITVTIEPESSIVMLSGPVFPLGTRIDIALMTTKTLDSTDDINIFYQYSEYKGITSKVNFGTSSSAFIESKVLYHRNKLDLVTNGTGAINTSEHLPSSYEPLLPKLPLVNAADYGNFTGTVHKTKEIMGGSYSADTIYNTPYAAGKDNYLSKVGVSQNKGTNSGGRFISSIEDSDSNIHKVLVGSTVEMIKNDGSKNFLPGEVALRVETNYLNGSVTPIAMNRISNSTISGESSNSFDLYKVEGRPLIKLNSK